MTRLFSDYAYGNGPVAHCYWSDTVPENSAAYPAATGDLRADVVVIGAGFTGLSAALHLAKDGVDVLVLDAQFPGWGASGRNGGFCCLGGAKASSTTLERRFGKAGLAGWRQAEQDAVALVRAILQEHGINADTHSEGETILAHNARTARDLQKDVAHVQAEYGVEATWQSPAELADAGMAGPFHGGLTIPVGFALNPRKYIDGLVRAATGFGARVHGHSPVEGITESGSGLQVSTARSNIRCKRLILATNGYSSEDLPPWMGGRYLPAQSNVLVTRLLTQAELDAAGWTSRQMAYDTRNLLHYFRLMPDNRFLFGMRGGLLASAQAEAGITARARMHFERMFPAWRNVDTPFGWSGMVCFSSNRVPYCGPIPDLPGAFAGFAYHGNGVAMGSYTGALLADLVQDKATRHRHPSVMQAEAPRFPLGRFRRALLPAGYALAGLRDL
ncbi:MAG: NAD(P)/FAD-dependent oxidoreductase [Rhodobacterales bacterium]